MNYTEEQLTDRLDQLEEYQDIYGQLTTGFVGVREIQALEALAEQYAIEYDDWFSDYEAVEKALVAS